MYISMFILITRGEFFTTLVLKWCYDYIPINYHCKKNKKPNRIDCENIVFKDLMKEVPAVKIVMQMTQNVLNSDEMLKIIELTIVE